MAAVQVLTGCNLRWWSFSSAIEGIYFLAHVVVRMVCVHVLARGHCNLHWWSFSIYIKKELSRTVVCELLLRATAHGHQTFPDYGRHTRSQSNGATCAKKPLPRSARQKTSKQSSAILNLRRKYTVFHARSYATNTKEEPRPLFMNSSRER